MGQREAGLETSWMETSSLVLIGRAKESGCNTRCWRVKRDLDQSGRSVALLRDEEKRTRNKYIGGVMGRNLIAEPLLWCRVAKYYNTWSL